MKDSIRLHPKHGVNPTIPACFICGEDKNEVALLGAASRKITGFDQAPMKGVVLNYEPCDRCKKLMKDGVILIGADESKTRDPNNPYRTGHMIVVSAEWIGNVMLEPMRTRVLQTRWAFCDQKIIDTICERAREEEATGEEDSEGETQG